MGDITSTYYGDISLKNTKWKTKRTILPHRCIFTGRWIKPFTRVAEGRYEYICKGTIISYYWTTPEELVMQKLKGSA